MANPHAINTLTVLVSFILGHYFKANIWTTSSFMGIYADTPPKLKIDQKFGMGFQKEIYNALL